MPDRAGAHLVLDLFSEKGISLDKQEADRFPHAAARMNKDLQMALAQDVPDPCLAQTYRFGLREDFDRLSPTVLAGKHRGASPSYPSPCPEPSSGS